MIGQSHAAPTEAPRRRCPLTDAELVVIRQLALGHDYPAIALQIGIAESTVRGRVFSACRRISASNRAHLVALAMSRGWIRL